MALFPLLGFMSGAVNPDAMLYAVSAALFFAFARAFRLGLTPGRAAAIGAVIAVGVLTKLNFIGLLPGAALALAILSAPRGAGVALGRIPLAGARGGGSGNPGGGVPRDQRAVGATFHGINTGPTGH